ncbi:hypothetical protein Q0601_17920 [Paracoccus onubensis]|uniref:hypothetical protein n=1 Tax=Paracoccus onubensis TaxID=1675788 RepID=UPI00272F056D|nr:hypothetical protein [Paracoccus onubensis]MDP0929066.1 hypothetical protein [Paracoccus onubensis]
MSDIAASERRLSAALDRMDQLLDSSVFPGERTGAVIPDPDISQELAAVRAENAQLRAEIDELRRAGESVAATTSEAAVDERLADAGEQAARLAAANDDLAAANQALIETVSGQGDADAVTSIRQALEAELEALRAARAAEISNLGDIIMELERLLPDDDGVSASGGHTEGDADRTGAGGAAENRQGVFSAVYDDASNDGDDTGQEDK